MNRAQQLSTLCVGMIGVSSILLTTNAFPFQLTSVFQKKQALLPALQSGKQPVDRTVTDRTVTDQTVTELAQGVPSLETTTPATPAEIAIRQQQVDVARQYENDQQNRERVGVGRRAEVVHASLVRMDYEIAFLQATQSFAEAIALREQQVDVAKEYDALHHRRLQAGVGEPEDPWEASFDRWEYELKLVQEKQALQDM